MPSASADASSLRLLCVYNRDDAPPSLAVFQSYKPCLLENATSHAGAWTPCPCRAAVCDNFWNG